MHARYGIVFHCSWLQRDGHSLICIPYVWMNGYRIQGGINFLVYRLFGTRRFHPIEWIGALIALVGGAIALAVGAIFGSLALERLDSAATAPPVVHVGHVWYNPILD